MASASSQDRNCDSSDFGGIPAALADWSVGVLASNLAASEFKLLPQA
jgi:hypothetical protein